MASGCDGGLGVIWRLSGAEVFAAQIGPESHLLCRGFGTVLLSPPFLVRFAERCIAKVLQVL